MEEYLLQLVALIGDERGSIVFATIQRGWYRDLSDCRRTEGREGHARAHGEWIETRFIADIMLHCHDDYFGEIDGRPAASSHD